MSHNIPSTLLSTTNGSHFVIYTDAGSISVSGAFSLLGDPSITTFASGTAVYITSGLAPSAVTFQADTGTASSQSGILKIVTPPIIGQYITTTATGNTISVQGNLISVLLGGTGETSLTQNSLLYGEGTSPVSLVLNQPNGQILLGYTNMPPQFDPLTSINNSLTFTVGSNSLNIDINQTNNGFFSHLPIQNGGTGRSFLTAYGVLLGEGSLSVHVTNPGTNGQVFIASTTGDPKFATITSTGGTLTFSFGVNSLNIDVNLSGMTFFTIVPVTAGGTGQTLLTAYGVLIGEGSFPITSTVAGTNGQLLIAANGADPQFATVTSSGGSLTFSQGTHSLNIDINLTNLIFSFILPPSNGGTGETLLTAHGVLIGAGSLGIHVTDPGTDGQVFLAASLGDPKFATITSTGNTVTFSFGHNSLNIEVNLSNTFFNPIQVSRGSLGQTFLTAYGVLIGEGSLPVQVTAPGTDGQVLIASSTGNPSFATITSTGSSLTFSFGHNSLNIDINWLSATFFYPITPDHGGTGQTFLTVHGVLIGEGSLDVHVTNAGTNGQTLIASTTGDPRFTTITSTGGSLSFTFGPNTLNIDVNWSGFPFFNPLPSNAGGLGQSLLTAYGVLLGGGSLGVNVTAPGTDGQLLLASSTGAPIFANITSSKHTIYFIPAHNRLNMEVGNSTAFTAEANIGIVFPIIDILNIFGQNAIVTTASASTIVIELDINAGSFFHPLPPGTGSTGRTLLTSHGVLIGEGSLQVNVTDPGTHGQVLIASTTGDPRFTTITSTGGSLTFSFGPNSLNIEINIYDSLLFNPLPVPNGGTRRTILTTHGIIIGQDSLPVDVSAPGTHGQTLIASSIGNPRFSTITSTGGTITFAFGANSLNMHVNLSQNSFFNPLFVSSGGTGNTFLTTFGVLVGEGSLDVDVTSKGTHGQTLIASSTGDPKFATISSTGGTLTFSFSHNSLNMDTNLRTRTFFNPLLPPSGGMGRTLLTTYGVLLGQSSMRINVTAAGTRGQIFIASSTGDPRFNNITSTGNSLTFTLGTNSLNIETLIDRKTFFNPLLEPNGGTGRTVLTTFGALIGQSSLRINTTSRGTHGQVLIGSSTGAPNFANITSTGNSLTFSRGVNSLNIDVRFTGNTLFSPWSVNRGGTSNISETPFTVLCGGTTSTSAIQNVLSVGVTGSFLTSQGTGTLPIFELAGIAVINVLSFTSSGTYTPTPGMTSCVVECVGGGGGSGGIADNVPGKTLNYSSAGGGGGGYAKKTFSSQTIGVSQTITIGAGGIAGDDTGGNGGAGGSTSFGFLLKATGGGGGQGANGNHDVQIRAGGAGGTGVFGDINVKGENGLIGWFTNIGGYDIVIGGMGGSSFFGGGGKGGALAGLTSGGSLLAPGQNGRAIGGGAGAPAAIDLDSSGGGGQGGFAGAVGAAGTVIITEYL